METEKTPEESQVKVERFSRNLRVLLSQDEIVDRAKRSAYLMGEIEQKAEERDAAKKQANAHIEELEAEMHRLSLEVRDGGSYRDVPCERRYIYRTGAVVEVRTDNGEVLTERPMTEREKQLELGLKKPDVLPTKVVDGQFAEADGVVDDDYKPEANEAEAPAKTKKGRKPKAPRAGADA
jgi:hypothetical protein